MPVYGGYHGAADADAESLCLPPTQYAAGRDREESCICRPFDVINHLATSCAASLWRPCSGSEQNDSYPKEYQLRKCHKLAAQACAFESMGHRDSASEFATYHILGSQFGTVHGPWTCAHLDTSSGGPGQGPCRCIIMAYSLYKFK